ncbi:MAG: hypothetical protein HY013_06325 [Candidatus Solibacter usitatus]|nr:hypothetical protein [Candidatus Solibacter usitatus]
MALGITVEHLRHLVRQYVTKEDADLELPVPPLRPTDLLLLKMLAEQGAPPVSAEPILIQH